MKALIAEDDFINRRVMQLLLAGYGKCDVADNGKSALRMFQEAYEDKKPYNLVCLDNVLPEMNGQELLCAIRNYEASRSIYGRDASRVMFISMDSKKETILDAFRNQCDGFMLKPFKKRDLIRFLVGNLLIEDKE
jgi:two-component system chemotaxis response regulator CheY